VPFVIELVSSKASRHYTVKDVIKAARIENVSRSFASSLGKTARCGIKLKIPKTSQNYEPNASAAADV